MQAAGLTQEVTSVFQAAKSLPPNVRELLAEELWASLDDDAPCEASQIEAMQLEEVRRRVEDYRTGREPSYSEEEVRAFLRSGRVP